IFPHTSNPDDLTLAHPGRDTDLQSLCRGLAGTAVGPLQGKSSHRALQHFFKRDQNVAFEIAAAASESGSLGRLGFWPRQAGKTAEASAATKKLFKEITEAGAVEPELVGLFTSRASPGLTIPARWRLDP